MTQKNGERFPCPLGTKIMLWLLGAGFVLSVTMGYVASANFRVVDPESLRNADEVFASFEEGDPRRMALRYVASELNRHFFSVYTYLHTGLFGVAAVLYFLARLKSRIVFLGLGFGVGLSLLYLFYFTPVLTEIGREIDFMSRDPKPPQVERFYSIHGVNIVLEMIKLGLILLMSAILLRSRSPEENVPA